MFKLRLLVCLFALFVMVSPAFGQDPPPFNAMDTVLNGLAFNEQVRYTLSLTKPQFAEFEDLIVTVTLPDGVQVIAAQRSNRAEFLGLSEGRRLTWSVQRVGLDENVPVLTFSTAAAFTRSVMINVEWVDTRGTQSAEYELYSTLITATASEASRPRADFDGNLVLLGDTGVLIAAAPEQVSGETVTARILSPESNPPAELGDFWWCSQLELSGAAGVIVYVPLRRPLPSDILLTLFQQQPDGSWRALDLPALVSADGQYAIYSHPGGVVATGTDTENQPAIVPPAEAPPDSDGDGIADPNDACAGQGGAGFGVDGSGCPVAPPDSDGDGIADPNDACVGQGDGGFGLDGAGCPIIPPDSDGDGLLDPVDACPGQGNAGFGLDGSGCPFPPPDSDGDGIADPNDACPSQGNAGFGLDGAGCPIPSPVPPTEAPTSTSVVTETAAAETATPTTTSTSTETPTETPSATPTITPTPLPMLTLNLSASVGFGAHNATLDASAPVAFGGLTLRLLSSDPTMLAVPPSVTIISGTRATFNFVVAETAIVGTPITISVQDANGQTLTTGSTSISGTRLTNLIIPFDVATINVPSSARVVLSHPAPPNGVVVTLSSSAAVTMPASVTVPSGATEANFTFTFTTNTLGLGAITATLGGDSFTRTLGLSFTQRIASVSVTNSVLSFAADSEVTITLSGPAPAGGLFYLVTPLNTSIAYSVFGRTSIPAGASSVTFRVGLRAQVADVSLLVLRVRSATDAADFRDLTFTTQPVTFTSALNNNNPRQGDPLTLTITSSVPASASGIPVIGRISIPTTIGLTSVAAVQGMIQPGETSVTLNFVAPAPRIVSSPSTESQYVVGFMAGAFNNTTAQPLNVVLPATATPTASPTPTRTLTATATFMPTRTPTPEAPVDFTLQVSVTTVSGAFRVSGTVSIPSARTTPLTINMSSSSPSIISVPSSVTIPAGQTRATFTITVRQVPTSTITITGVNGSITRRATIQPPR